MQKQVVLAIVCALAWAGQSVRGQEYTSVADAAGKLNLTRVIAAAALANLTAELSDPALQAIVLAPSDAAFDRAAAAAGATIPNATVIGWILKYHVIPQTVDAAVINASATYETLVSSEFTDPATATPTLTFKIINETTAYVGGVAPGAYVTLNGSVVAGKSRVYQIESVLVPPAAVLTNGTFYPTIAAAATALGQNSILLGDVLPRANASVAAALTNPDSMLTVFAPNDPAFTNLLAYFGNNNINSSVFLGDMEGITNLLFNHVLSVPTVAPADGDNITTNSLAGRPITFSNVGGQLTVTSEANEGRAAKILGTQVAGKSIVYIIDDIVFFDTRPVAANNTNTTAPPPPPVDVSPAPMGLTPPSPAVVVSPSPSLSTPPPPSPSAAELPARITTSLLAATTFAAVFLFAMLA